MPPVKLLCALLSTVPTEQGPTGPFQNQVTGHLVKGMLNQSTILNKFTYFLLGHNAKRNLDAKHEARSTFQSPTWVVA